MAKSKLSKSATKKSKPQPFAKTQDGVIGPKNPQNYGKGKKRG